MTQNAKRYTSVSKGGEFEMVGTSSGAGQRKGDVVIVYRNIETGQILHREPEDFAMRMKPAPDTKAQLLAALEATVQAWEKGEDIFGGMQNAKAVIAAAKGAV